MHRYIWVLIDSPLKVWIYESYLQWLPWLLRSLSHGKIINFLPWLQIVGHQICHCYWCIQHWQYSGHYYSNYRGNIKRGGFGFSFTALPSNASPAPNPTTLGLSSSLTPSAPPSIQVTASTPATEKKQARVLYDYDAADASELSLLADEVLCYDRIVSSDTYLQYLCSMLHCASVLSAVFFTHLLH